MNTYDAIMLFFTLAILAALPSTSVALVVTRSASGGVVDGIAVAAGIVAGDLVFVLLALLGLSVVANNLGSLFMGIKYLGGAYLIGFGLTLLISNPEAIKVKVTIEHPKKWKCRLTSFLAGFFITLGDIKAIIFYASLYPVFVDMTFLKLTDMAMIVSITITAVGGVKIAYAVTATKLAALPWCQTMATVIKRMAGGFMVAAGGFMIAKT